MGRYVALLRGINVGPSSRLAMAELREIFAELGYGSVRTHLQSGNVLFDSVRHPDDADSAALSAAILARSGVRSRVLVLAADEFLDLAAANPLIQFADDPSKLVITFAGHNLSAAEIDRPTDDALAPERLVVAERAIYQWCPDGILKSKLSPHFWKQFGQDITSRNARTVDKLVELLGAPA